MADARTSKDSPAVKFAKLLPADLTAAFLSAKAGLIASLGETEAAGAASDLAGNLSAASTSTDNSVTFGTPTAPSVTINQAVGQADPTNSSPISFTVHFSLAVTGCDSSDIVFNGSTVGGTLFASVSGSMHQANHGTSGPDTARYDLS